ncbi:hypothetical protein [Rhizobium leguminosarum]
MTTSKKQSPRSRPKAAIEAIDILIFGTLDCGRRARAPGSSTETI